MTLGEAFELAKQFHAGGQLAQADQLYQVILQAQPDNAGLLQRLGVLADDMGQSERGAAYLLRAVALQPQQPFLHSSLGLIYQNLGRLEDAVASGQTSVRLKPDYAEGHYNLGNALQKQGRMVEAEACYREALRLRPNFPDALNNLGYLFEKQGLVREMEACFHEVLRLKPDDAAAHRCLLFCMNYHPGVEPAAMLAAHRAWASLIKGTQLFSEVGGFGKEMRPLSCTERRLRVGYVSPDFCQHSVPNFLEPILAHHDAQQVELFCYAEVATPDAVTARFRSLAHHWRSTRRLSDDQVAESIRTDGIDVLVDLAGHTANNRLAVFARKPAPVQVTYLGYPNTTGLDTIDYRLTDAVADPPEMTERFYTEKLFRLPETFLCYGPPADCPIPLGSLAVSRGYITFGSFNTLAKFNPMVAALWAKLLKAVPGSRLMLKALGLADEKIRRSVREQFGQLGVDASRLDLRGREASPAKHMAMYNEVDVALDTFPYHGTTTTCEALWMGVPVVTLAGNMHASRVGASLLTCVGLGELVAQTSDEFIGIALRLAEDRERLARLRSGLREQVRCSPLCDAKTFTRRLEEAYRVMWRRWCVERHSAESQAARPGEPSR